MNRYKILVLFLMCFNCLYPVIRSSGQIAVTLKSDNTMQYSHNTDCNKYTVNSNDSIINIVNEFKVSSHTLNGWNLTVESESGGKINDMNYEIKVNGISYQLDSVVTLKSVQNNISSSTEKMNVNLQLKKNECKNKINSDNLFFTLSVND